MRSGSVLRVLAMVAVMLGGYGMSLPSRSAETPSGDGSVRRKLDERTELEVGRAVAAALSKPGETRWGFHQFPALARLPGGRILLTYSNNEDAVATYGTACPALVSADGGRTWEPLNAPDSLGVKPHASACEVAPGEFLCVPPVRPFDLKAAGLTMPEAIARTAGGNGQVELHEFEKCPPAVREFVARIDAWRWTAGAAAWKPEKVAYDTGGLLVWKRAAGKWATGAEAHLVPRTWFEHPPVKVGDELIYADYRAKYALEGRKAAPAAPSRTSTCMVSTDKGRSWQRRGTIAIGDERRPMDEPVIAPTADGRLACAIRTDPGPLVVTFSSDRGRTWTPVEPLHKFGVFPGLILLENKVLVVSFGRPGVHLKFSLDGAGRKWSEPVSLIPPAGKWAELSCGYTSLLALGPDEFLVAYSDFRHRDAKGRTCKAILVRRVKVAVSGK